ncbi:thiamine biosynthesis protein ThiF [Streptomyces abyssalis]|uniref:Thiamine biosynthesis protein ThiF n=1 Tax=Streptomyces abyssalis TaxID=933944 RepID=A0A1E7JGE4_9ACTN|nr:ThiF family adenylyltransferase [Streptomyces abyssalis]OEU85520.1 thiamine biosynthesis protein ThiF [Streptomyces abyssalis]OEU93016.1 thiamine biosynthesis protein ThiF [Streptomyces abyssalis]OEV30814.1 thiamine biosynthesis protein ThiF [Streptomyces nanshensis]
MHPMIKPALRRAWRDGQTVQYGVAPAHAVLLGPVDNTTAAFMESMDGTRSLVQLRDEAARLGLREGAAEQLVDRLASAGVLDDATADRSASAGVGDRLRPDLASLSVVHRKPGDGLRRLAARRDACVQVRGAGRVGALVAATLSAAGVGEVVVVDGGHVEPWDTAPGGISPDDCGERRDVAARRAVSRARPWRSQGSRRRSTARSQRAVRLVVLAPRDGLDAYAPDPGAAEGFVEAGTPHLYGGVVESTGFVGPLVTPGVSPCAGCILRSRAEREPSWPLVVGQWRMSARRRSGVPACDSALATVAAGAIASYALGFLDGDGACASGYRIRFALPHLIGSSEQFSPHPGCPCGASSVTAGRPVSADAAEEVTMA